MSSSSTPQSRTIKRAFKRTYSDNGQTVAYVEWSDGATTEEAISGHCMCCGAPRRMGMHMKALFARAKREGVLSKPDRW